MGTRLLTRAPDIKTANGQHPAPTSDAPVYAQVLPIQMLRVIAALALVLSIPLMLIGIFDPLRFENETARFMLCLIVATLLGIFFFIFYPERLEMKLPVALGTTLRVAGPTALWLGVFLMLLQLFPTPTYSRVFEIYRDGKPGGMYLGDKTTTYLAVKDGKPPPHLLIGANNGNRDLFGIYVSFPSNVRKIEALLHHQGWAKPLPVVLTRDGSGIIDVSDVEEKEP